jgi:DNA-binding Xre family transcriptional regulator
LSANRATLIYFAQNPRTGHIKIGTTIDVEARLRTLASQHGRLELLGVIEGGRPFESALHLAFAAHVVPGMGREWFFDVDPIYNYIKRYADHRPVLRREPQPVTEKPSYDRSVNSHLYDLIAKKREQPGFESLSIADISRETGLSRQTINQLARNRTTQFDKTTMIALCHYFRCGVGDILKLRD